MSNETILGILITIIILNSTYLIYYYGFKAKKVENISNRQKQWAIFNGIFIIVSFFMIVLYELLEYKYRISWHPYFGKILTSIEYIAFFVLMITVTLGETYYKRYTKVLPNWVNVIHHIGIVILIMLALYIYIMIESVPHVLM